MDISLLRSDRRIWPYGPDGPRGVQDAIITPPPVPFEDEEWARLTFLERHFCSAIFRAAASFGRALCHNEIASTYSSPLSLPMCCACGCGRTSTGEGGCPSLRECQLPRSVTAHWVDPRYQEPWLADDRQVFLEPGVIVYLDGSRFHIPGGRAWLEAKLREIDPTTQSTALALQNAERAVSNFELAQLEKAAEEEPVRFSSDLEDPADVEAAEREQQAFARDTQPEPIGPVSVVEPAAKESALEAKLTLAELNARVHESLELVAKGPEFSDPLPIDKIRELERQLEKELERRVLIRDRRVNRIERDRNREPFTQHFSEPPATDKKELIRGYFHTRHWLVPGDDPECNERAKQAEELDIPANAWQLEIDYIMKTRGRAFLQTFADDPAEAKADLRRDLFLWLLKRRFDGDGLPYLTKDSQGKAARHPNVVQACKLYFRELPRNQETRVQVPNPAVPLDQNGEPLSEAACSPDGTTYTFIKDGINKGKLLIVDENGARLVSRYALKHLFEPLSKAQTDRSYNGNGDSPEDEHVEALSAENAIVADKPNLSEKLVEETVDQAKDQQILRQALSRLRNQQQAFVFRATYGFDSQEMSREEIARALSTTEANVDKLRMRGTEAIRKEIVHLNPRLKAPQVESVFADAGVDLNAYGNRRPRCTDYSLELKWMDFRSLLRMFMSESEWTDVRARLRKHHVYYFTGDVDPESAVEVRSLPPLKYRACPGAQRTGCVRQMIVTGHRKPLHLGDASKYQTDGTLRDCPLCRVLSRRCPLCMTQDHLNSLCNFCFAEAVSAEWERRREKRLQAVPSLDSTYSAPTGSARQTWLLDLTKAGVDWQAITMEYTPIGEMDGRILFSPSVKGRSDLRAQGFSTDKGILIVLHDALSFSLPEEAENEPLSVPLSQIHTPRSIADARADNRRPALLSDEDQIDRRKRVMQGRIEAAQALWQSFKGKIAQKGLTPDEVQARFAHEHQREADLLKHQICRKCGLLTPKPGRICAKCQTEEAA